MVAMESQCICCYWKSIVAMESHWVLWKSTVAIESKWLPWKPMVVMESEWLLWKSLVTCHWNIPEKIILFECVQRSRLIKKKTKRWRMHDGRWTPDKLWSQKLTFIDRWTDERWTPDKSSSWPRAHLHFYK
jgi:hypothetical protein